VRDQSSGSCGSRVSAQNEKTGEDRTVTNQRQCFFVGGSLKPSTYTIRVRRSPAFSRLDYTAMPWRRQELTLDSSSSRLACRASPSSARADLDSASASQWAPRHERECAGLVRSTAGDVVSLMPYSAPVRRTPACTWGASAVSGRPSIRTSSSTTASKRAGSRSAPGVFNGKTPASVKLQRAVENVQEFPRRGPGLPREYGERTGGQGHVITNQAPNILHGSVVAEYLRCRQLDAANALRLGSAMPRSVRRRSGNAPTVPKSPLTLNQFGGLESAGLVARIARSSSAAQGYRLERRRN